MTLITITSLLLMGAGRHIAAFIIGLTGVLGVAAWIVGTESSSLLLFAAALSVVLAAVAAAAMVDSVSLSSEHSRIFQLLAAVSAAMLVLHSPLFIEGTVATTFKGSSLAVLVHITAKAIEAAVQVAIPLLLVVVLIELPLVWLGRLRGLRLQPLAATLAPLAVIAVLASTSRMITDRLLGIGM